MALGYLRGRSGSAFVGPMVRNIGTMVLALAVPVVSVSLQARDYCREHRAGKFVSIRRA